MPKPTPISTEKLSEEFRQILKDPENRRILISGIFGIGKTTFIREFFDSHTSEYVCLKLFPVNYSVATNEDIFELIKYDILYELLRLNPAYERVDVGWSEALHFMTFEDIRSILADFVFLIPRFGKSIRSIGDALVKTVKIFDKKRQNLGVDDLGEIVKFAKKVQNARGGIYENDFYTQLIESLIGSLRVNSNGEICKEVVLVIGN